MTPTRSLSILIVAALPVFSAQGAVQIRELHATSLAHSSDDTGATGEGARLQPRVLPDDLGQSAVAPAPFALYPVAGTQGGDIYIPYYVDLDPGAGVRDFNCTSFTFNGHTGQDPYIRSFREQRIGVPVFAPLDGVVADVHDGEPDENTTAVQTAPSNYVVLDHSPEHRTIYLHLKKGSITVAKGQAVTAGTQIAEVGSSGPSTAPHVHFQADFLDQPYEPYAGPCRPGASSFRTTPVLSSEPVVIGVSFSNISFGNYPSAPFDDAPRTSTFAAGRQLIYFKTEIANVPAGSTYQITFQPPSGGAVVAGGGTLSTTATSRLDSFWWGIDADLTEVGNWSATLVVNGRAVVTAPFLVVSSASQIANRPPAPVSAALEPSGMQAGDVPVCRTSASVFADPDYDVLSYRYQWRVNDQLVRDVTTAALSDALPRQYAMGGNRVSCTVTATDGQLTTAPAVASAQVTIPARRRGVVR